MRVVFMGTPEFAVESLKCLVEGGYNVVAVVTQPDKPVGRHGSVLCPPEVKKYALSVGLPVLQPVKMKNPAFVESLAAYKADLQVVVAYRMLPEIVWAMPRFGTFNVHASLLPKYRGAAPINWAVINGETETGVTTFFLDHEIDTGRIIMQKSFHIPPVPFLFPRALFFQKKKTVTASLHTRPSLPLNLVYYTISSMALQGLFLFFRPGFFGWNIFRRSCYLTRNSSSTNTAAQAAAAT